jgi:hypothetical protein
MATTDLAKRKERVGIEIVLFNSNCARIRSDWLVTSPRGDRSVATEWLSKALEEGVEAKCDTKRSSFFEVGLGHAWFYFHIAYELSRVYLIAAVI